MNNSVTEHNSAFGGEVVLWLERPLRRPGSNSFVE